MRHINLQLIMTLVVGKVKGRRREPVRKTEAGFYRPDDKNSKKLKASTRTNQQEWLHAWHDGRTPIFCRQTFPYPL